MAGSMCPATVLSGPSCARVSSPSWNVLNRASKCFIRVSKFAPLFCGALKTRKRGNFASIFDLTVKISLVLCVGCFKENPTSKFHICGLVCLSLCGFDA